MSHPDPTSEHHYPEDNVTHYPTKKKAMKFGLKHLLTTDHKASVKAGKRNAAISKVLMKKQK